MRIFYEKDFSSFEKERKHQILDVITTQSGQSILDGTVEDQVKVLFEKFKLVPIKVSEQPVKIPRPTKRVQTIAGHFGREQVEIYEFELEYPIEGSLDMLDVVPSSHTLETYDVEVDRVSKTVKYDVTVMKASAEEFEKAKASAFARAFVNIININRDVDSWNSSIMEFLTTEVEKQRDKLKNEEDFYKSINVE